MFHVQRSIRPRSPRRGLPMESQPSCWIHTPGCTCNGVAGMNEGARWRFLGSFSTDDSGARFHVKRAHSYLAGATATRAPSWGRPRSFAIAGPTGGRRTQCRPDIHNWGGRSHTIQPALNHQADNTASEGAVEHGGVLSLRPARPGHAPTARRLPQLRVSARIGPALCTSPTLQGKGRTPLPGICMTESSSRRTRPGNRVSRETALWVRDHL